MNESDLEEPQKEQRIFSRRQKEECWNKAALMKGRHPSRWRLDAVGNPVLKYLTNCRGQLCHQYDHILPYSKGGKTEVENCQLLQSFVNLFKSNKIDVPFEDLRKVSPIIEFEGIRIKALKLFIEEHYDAIEKAIYNNVLRPENPSEVKRD